MAFRTIAEDCAVQTIIGPAVDGGAITFSAASSIKSLAKKIEIDEGINKVPVHSIGDGLDKLRFNRSNFRVRLSLQVPDSGCVVGYGKVGYSFKVQVKALSSLSSYESFVGAITSRRLTINQDNENIEEVEIEGGIEGYTYSSNYA